MNTPDSPVTGISDHQIKRLVLEYYDQLYEAATLQIAGENPGQSLEVSGLINEAVCRLLQTEKMLKFKDADHFLGTAVTIMKHVLIDRARHKSTLKAGGQFHKKALGDYLIGQDQFILEVLIVKDELARLAAVDKQAADVVELRCQGFTLDEVAGKLHIPRSTTVDLWNFGRAWLLKSLDRAE